MSYTVLSYALGDDFSTLESNVATAIAAGKQPFGPPVEVRGLLVQPMTSGTPTVDLQGYNTFDTAYSADGAVGVNSGVKLLTKGSAGAYTLAAPAANGDRIVIIADSAFAHVVTATGLIHDGVTGGAKNTATFAAFVGASIELLGYNSKWYVISKNVVTIA